MATLSILAPTWGGEEFSDQDLFEGDKLCLGNMKINRNPHNSLNTKEEITVHDNNMPRNPEEKSCTIIFHFQILLQKWLSLLTHSGTKQHCFCFLSKRRAANIQSRLDTSLDFRSLRPSSTCKHENGSQMKIS